MILVDLDVPVGAISALGKGLGFVQTPTADSESIKLDMRRAINNIAHLSRRNANRKQQPYEKDPYELPHKLKHVNYNKAWPTPDEQVQQTTERMQDELDNELRKSNRTNGHRQYFC